ncbi:MAG: GGDEF domain-containing protein [Bacillota bacterium]
MRSKKTGKVNMCFILLVASLLSMLGLVSLNLYTNSILDKDSSGITKIELISSSVQRISKLELEGSDDTSLVLELEGVMSSLVPANGESQYFVKSEEVALSLQMYRDEFNVFFDAIEQFRVDGNRDALFTASEYHYGISEALIEELSAYNEERSGSAQTINLFMIANIILIFGCMAKIFFNTHLEIAKSKELSKEMYMDTATGVFNRAKCQQILKKLPHGEAVKERAIVIFDLNDLKKTNDSLGHRAGDELISDFAEQLRGATHVVSEELFLGRYGGDEFIAFFESTDESEVQLYLKEVDALIERFNEINNKPFTLSCAAGYAITSEETKMVSTRELFDVADGNMYENKIAMKARKKQEEYIKEREKMEESLAESDSAESKA